MCVYVYAPISSFLHMAIMRGIFNKLFCKKSKDFSVFFFLTLSFINSILTKLYMVKVRGYELQSLDLKQASSRKALQLKNTIIVTLKKLSVHEDSITVKEEAVAIKRAPASVSWYMDGQNLYYSYTPLRYIENLYIVSQVLEYEVQSVLSGEKSREDCVQGFMEDKEIEVQRIKARKLLGVSYDCYDFDLISKKYKDLSKTHHPDMGGDLEVFQQINNAHKMLKRELC